MRQVNLFVVGMQKAGTTALDYMLRCHPAIQMASRKEPHFFDDETIDWNRPDHALFHAFFGWTSDPELRGEATPIYSYWPGAIERIREYNSRAKIIVCLRHPSYRAHSHWRMERQRGLDHLSFSEAIRSGRKRVRDASRGVHRVYSYVERGFYASQIRRLLVNFPSQNILLIRNDRLWANPKLEMWRVYDFLGVNSSLGEAGREYITPLDAPEATPMSLVDRTYLDALFANDIVETDQLTGLGLHDWLSPGYLESIRLRDSNVVRRGCPRADLTALAESPTRHWPD